LTDSNAPKAPFHDPNAEAEAQKYENPVASRDALLALLEQLGHPATHAEVCEALGETDEDRVEALRRRLIAMSRDGQLISNRRSQFAPLRKVDLVTGVVMGHRDGYGFVLRDGADDVYLSNRQMSKVFHGDRVAVQILGLDRRGRPEGKIVEVLERNTQQIVGRYFDQSGVGVVQPDNKRVAQEILIPPVGRKGAEHGQFVVVQIVEQPKPGGLPMGEVVEVLGDHLAPGMEIDVAIRSHNIPHEWPEAVLVKPKNCQNKSKIKTNTTASTCVSCLLSPSTVKTPKTSTMPSAANLTAKPVAGVYTLPLPMYPITYRQVRHWMLKLTVVATRCISLSLWYRCCRKNCPTVYAR